MNDKKQIAKAGIGTAIIVDDGYDEIPLVEELLDEDSWDSFFDDTQGADATRIEAFFPKFKLDTREDHKSSQDFVNALWKNRGTISNLLNGLFDVYEQKVADNAPFLTASEAALTALGIPFTTHGRDFVDAAVKADLILIDLFLGIQQGAPDRKLTVKLLKDAINQREGSLPSIILISQISTINESAKDFRRDVHLHASAFRHIRKPDLKKPGRVQGLILTLAAHRADSQALATFVETWEKKAKEAVGEAASALRKIDIDDLQHIRSMLLRFEGLKTSSYMLNVFDRVLQYEIEAHGEVLDAAIPLDDMSDPAPLMISNDRDTYAVLERTLFVNPKRRAHVTGAVWPITFGDILGQRPGSEIKPRGFLSGRSDLVFFVASPECDLIREGRLTTALLISGTLSEIDITKPGLAVTSKTTPVLRLEDGRRFQVDWNFGDLRTINLAQAKRLLHSNRGDLSVVGQLRERSALALRQQLLSNVGRVGELAPLPRSLKFKAELHYPLEQGKTNQIMMPEGVTITGNIFFSRRGRFATLIIDSEYENELTTELLGIDILKIPGKSKAMFKELQEQSRLRQLFRSGLQGIILPLNEPRKAGLLKLGVKQPDSDEKRPKIDTIATIFPSNDVTDKQGQNFQNAGLIFFIEMEDVG